MEIVSIFRNGGGMPLADAALLYAGAGLPVFACAPGAKRPATSNGLTDATTDSAQVAGWWARWPDANIGLATGHNGFDVVDVDRRPDGSGFEALERARRVWLVDGWVCQIRTPSGGIHLYYPAQVDRPQRSWANTTAHLDFRGSGGYVIVPPSRVTQADGTVGTYRIASGRRSGRPVDGAALKALLQPTRPPRRSAPPTLSAWRGGAIATWLGSRPEGARNNALFWSACRYAEAAIDQADAHQQLGAAAKQVGLAPAEIAATIRSAYRTATPAPTQRHPNRPRMERSL